MKRNPCIAAVVFPALAITCGTANAQEAGPEWDYYGHLNLGIISVDDGFDTETSLTDNDNSNSRVGIIFKQGLQNGGEFRFHFETALGFTGSSAINQTDNDFDVEYRRTELRKFEIIYDTASIGKFSFGQGSTATDGSAEADLSGTTLIAYSSPQDQAGQQEFRLAGGGASGVTVGNAISSFDGSRRFRVRYDTPGFNGFSFAMSGGREVLSSGNDDAYYDFGLTYDRDHGNYKVVGHLGYSIRGSAEELLVGSGSVLHEPTGLSLTVASGRQQQGDDGYVYVKTGWQRDWFSVGRSYLSVDFYQGEDFQVTGSSSSSVGFGVVQTLDRYNLELYASYRSFGFEAPGARYEALDVTFVGARWKF